MFNVLGQVFQKPLKWRLTFCLFMCWVAVAMAYAKENENIVGLQFSPRDGMLFASYSLKDPENKYFSAILDELKAGRQLRIQHDLNIETVGGWSKTLQENEYSYFVSYDLYSSEFSFEENDGHVYRTKDEDVLRTFLFTLKDMPVIQMARLTTGDEYLVTIKSKFREDDRRMPWYKAYTFSWFKKHVEAEVLYIAR